MNTHEFLQTILPPEGVYFIGVMHAGRPGVGHIPCDSLEVMAKTIAKLDSKPGVTVYHACSAYKEPYVLDGEKKKYRIASNLLSAKAFWVDLDCGEAKAAEGKGYATKKDAAKAIFDFCKLTSFPLPLLIDSGNGLHAYWPLTEAIAPEVWNMQASILKEALAKLGVLADPTRTADMASILRPVGSMNKKNPDLPKEVKAKNTVPAYTPDEIIAALSNIVSNFDVECKYVPTYASDLNDDLTAHLLPSLPCDAELIATKCPQVRAMKGQGKGYEHWRGVMGIVSFCERKDEIAHEWSSLHPLYDRGATQQKIDTWNSPPTLCETLEKANPGGCEGCPHKGKVKTPLILGRIEPEVAPIVTEIVVGTTVVKSAPINLPKGYKYDEANNLMVRFCPDKDGNLQQHPFASMLFYLTHWIEGSGHNAEYSLRVRSHLPKKRIRDFEIASSIAGSPQLLGVLSGNMITQTSTKDSGMHLSAYIRDSMNNLMRQTDQMNTFTTFGWNKDMTTFLIGDRLYHTDGSVETVIVGGMAASKLSALHTPKGKASGWASGVNAIYSRDGMCPMQYAICSGFGSILSPFGDDTYKGIPIALTGESSGQGKTTACRAALYAFGDAEELYINGDGGATFNARPALMGAFNNIPIMVDEITKIKGEALSALLYQASNGKDKIRLKAGTRSGVELTETNSWCMSMYLTANKHLSAALSENGANTEAEGVRIMEIQTDTYNTPRLDPRVIDVGVEVAKMSRNAGSAGAEFISWCVQHVDDISAKMSDYSRRLALSSATSQQPQYRFYRQHAVCTLVAAEIMVELGLVSFDLEKLFAWTVAHIEQICADVTELNKVSSDEAFYRMTSALSPRVLVSFEYRDARATSGPEKVRYLNDAPAGRAIIGAVTEQNPFGRRLYLVKTEVQSWCHKERVNKKKLLQFAMDNGILVEQLGEDKHRDRFSLGRGTDNPAAGQQYCYCFNLDKMQGDATATLQPVPAGGIDDQSMEN